MAEHTVTTSRDTFVATLTAGAEPGTGPLASLRAEALERAATLPVPTTRDEEWRFTPLGALLELSYGPAPEATVSAEALEAFVLPEAVDSRLVFVNGRFQADLSSTAALGDGVRVGRLADALVGPDAEAVKDALGQVLPVGDDLFTALNQAHLSDDAPCVVIDKDVAVEAPLHLLSLAAPEGDGAFAIFPRALVVVGRGSKATVVEEHAALGQGRYLVTSAIETAVASDATVHHVKVIRDDLQAIHVARTGAWVRRGSNYESVSVTLGAKLARHDIRAIQKDQEGHAALHGLAFIGGEQLADTHSVMDHAKPHGTSDQVHKIVAGGRARGVFNGKIFVRPKAQKTAAEQLSRSLLLSRRALVDTKPQLEIFADDVRCTHGATIGQMEGDELFYLQSRGLGVEQARQTLTLAFAGEVIAKIPVPSVKAALREQLVARLAELDA